MLWNILLHLFVTLLRLSKINGFETILGLKMASDIKNTPQIAPKCVIFAKFFALRSKLSNIIYHLLGAHIHWPTLTP